MSPSEETVKEDMPRSGIPGDDKAFAPSKVKSSSDEVKASATSGND